MPDDEIQYIYLYFGCDNYMYISACEMLTVTLVTALTKECTELTVTQQVRVSGWSYEYFVRLYVHPSQLTMHLWLH